MIAAIRAIEVHLPEKILSTGELDAAFPDWQVAKIDERTGIRSRHIADPAECSSDLAVIAAQKLFASGACRAEEIDFILLCTQTPDYFVPSTACLVQQRLGIPEQCGALDYNLGSSGFVYGLGLAQGLIETGQARRILLLTAETYSKFLNPEDRSVRTIFGDGAAAVLVAAMDGTERSLGPFVYGTDGGGAANLIVRNGAMRARAAGTPPDEPAYLHMNGAEIFNFTLRAAPSTVRRLLDQTGRRLEDIDYFVFHQANRQILDHLRRSLKIDADKFCISIEHGNCASASIPIALKNASPRLKPGDQVMLVAFGPGYSWAGGLVRWA